jgi:hypothetical protein
MKSTFILSVLLLTGTLSYAQEYIPFPTTDAQWTVVYYSRHCEEEPLYTTVFHYQLYGDTVISGNTYRKLGVTILNSGITTPEIIGGLREENKKVYYFSLPATSTSQIGTLFSGREALLYDFNAIAGTTVDHDSSYHYNSTVQGIDSVMIGNMYRKRFNTSLTIIGGGRPEYWVEGIGSMTAGLISNFTPVPTCGYRETRLVCFSQNGNQLYLNPDYLDCNATPTLSIPGISQGALIKIYPNPALMNEIHINDIIPEDGVQVKITDYTGRVLMTKELKQRDNVVKLPRVPFCILILSDKQGRTLRIEKVIGG